MLENVRERYRKMVEKNEAADIQTCQNHPRAWLGLMLLYPIIWTCLGVFMFSQDVSGIVLILISIPFLAYIEKAMYDRYRKAFPKQN